MVLGILGIAACSTGASAERAKDLDEQWRAVLLDRTQLSAQERTEQAEAVLSADRWRRIDRIRQEVVESGWRIALRASPHRIWRGIRHVARRIRDLPDRGEAENIALNWLAPAFDPIQSSQRSELYERLRERELDQLAEDTRKRAAAALADERFDLARSLLERTLELEPGSEASLDLFADLEQREQTSRLLEPRLTIRDWDALLAEAILSKDFQAALQTASVDAEVELTQAAAHLLMGDRESGRLAFETLASRTDPVGRVASSWLERPELDVEGELTRAVRAYRWKRLLGWIGGNALAERGTSSVTVWRRAFTLTNMGISLPARIIRGWKPDGRPVREAAIQYLDQYPHGAKAKLARDWLDHVGWPEVDALGFQGKFQLPGVQVSFERISVPPVIVSRRAIHSEYVSGGSSALASALEGSQAVRLEARRVVLPQTIEDELTYEGFAFAPATARRLIDDLSFGVEQERFRWSLESREAALDRLQRIDRALERGWVLFAESWAPSEPSFWSALTTTAIDGTSYRGSVGIDRGKEDIIVVHHVGSTVQPCPGKVLCLDMDGVIRTSLYGYLDASSGAGFGFQSSTSAFAMGLGMTQDGPRIALSLPVGRWIGIERWLPIEAQLAVGPGSTYIGPVLRKQKCAEAAENERGSLQRSLPLRSHCVIRLY